MDFLGPPDEVEYIPAKVSFSLVLKAIAQSAVTPQTVVIEIVNHEWKSVLPTRVRD